MFRTGAVLCLALLVAPFSARAECPSEIVGQAISARVRADQVDALLRDAIKLLPEAIEVPSDPIQLLGCVGPFE
ncbi:MAG: hypothetical protein AAF658_20600, partial [Myxococcota bacterium]